ncbi:MAG: hypothetical protein ABIH28_02370 [archaeon]
MVEKRGEKSNSHEESKGIMGFTLGIVGLLSLFSLMLPVIFSLALIWVLTLSYFIVGLIFCRIQQKRNKTKKGKIGFIINLIGLIISVLLLIVSLIYIFYNFPAIQQALQQSQTFPGI